MPLSVARWLEAGHRREPSAALFFGDSMFNLSGAINVALFLFSQSQLLLFGPPVFEPELVPTQPATDPVDQSPRWQLNGVNLGNDFQELRSIQTSERSRNSMVQPGDNSSQGLHDII
jgi:hypothetical protein